MIYPGTTDPYLATHWQTVLPFDLPVPQSDSLLLPKDNPLPTNIASTPHPSMPLQQREPLPSHQGTADTRPTEVPPADAGPLPAPKRTALQQRLLQEALVQRKQKMAAAGTPYVSSKATGLVGLNGEVTVQSYRDPSRPSPAVVVCRHLALEFAQNLKKRDLMATFSTADGIQEKFDKTWNKAESAFNQTIRESPPNSKHVTSNDQFGSCLVAIAQQLKPPGSSDGPSQANFILLTSNHAMALHVEKKQKVGVDYVTVKVYDPNATNQYMRIEKPTPEGLRDLKLEDMLIGRKPQLELYSPGESQPLAVLSLDHALQPGLGQAITTPSPERMFLAMKLGLTDTVKQMLDLEAARSRSDKPEKLLALFQAKDDADVEVSISGLGAAIEQKQSETVGACIDWVLDSNLTLKEKVALLEAMSSRDDCRIPALAKAFVDGDAKTLQVFVSKILASNLPHAEKVHLLTAKVSLGSEVIPGLALAFNKNDADKVRGFTEAVLASNLDSDAKVQILAAKVGEVTGLSAAFFFRQFESIFAFTEAVLASNLDSGAKLNLLTAQGDDGIPAPFLLLHEGSFDTFQQFTKLVLASNLDSDAKVKLLDAKVQVGYSCLSVAFISNAFDEVRTFTETVLASNLDPDSKVKLLSPKLLPGTQRQSRRSVHEFTQAVRRSNLSEPHKESLLSPHRSLGSRIFDVRQRFSRLDSQRPG